MKKLIILVAIIIVAGCISKKTTTSAVDKNNPTQADVDRVKLKYPDYTLSELHNGKTLYEKHCGTCHSLKKPASEPEQEWNKIVPKMVVKVNKKEGNVLDTKAEESILRYVVTMTTAPKTNN